MANSGYTSITANHDGENLHRLPEENGTGIET